MEYIVATFLGWVASKWQGHDSLSGREFKFVTQVLACMACGFLPACWELFTTGNFEWSQIMGYAATSFAASQAYYNLYFYKK